MKLTILSYYDVTSDLLLLADGAECIEEAIASSNVCYTSFCFMCQSHDRPKINRRPKSLNDWRSGRVV